MTISNDSLQDPDPAAGLSSASRCIELFHLVDNCGSDITSNINHQRFHPVYTHQFFENEYIPGYQPFNSECKNDENSRFHKSLKSHEYSSSNLQLSIYLSPSCESCILRIKTQDKDNAIVTSTNENNDAVVKKRKILGESHANINQLSMKDIIESISKGLPPILHTIYDTNKKINDESKDGTTLIQSVRNQFLRKPIGIPLEEYYRKTNQTFVICLANHESAPNLSTYHNQIQPLAFWSIENASNVDLGSDEGGGYWNALYLFQKHRHGDNKKNEEQSYKFSLVGYITLFGFYSPFRKPKSGIVLRICQALILPPYQRCGHGKMMLKAIYKYVHGSFDSKIKSFPLKSDDEMEEKQDQSQSQQEIVEVNVEDPALSFQALRNKADYELFKENFEMYGSWEALSPVDNEQLFLPSMYYDHESFQTLKKKDTIVAATKAKLSKLQIHVAYEIFKLSSRDKLISSLPSTSAKEDIAQIEKKYRLMVKKRLNIFYAEDIGAFATTEAKKQKLGLLFEETLIKYERILLS
mmetsp:Transcript_2150/g.3091  ORF Transcript_2150/g.3091 Transcript_2150/m.3091 type:complete len:525 (-) Transcript_2150:52-1626(-)